MAAPTLAVTANVGYADLLLTTDAAQFADIYRVQQGQPDEMIRNGVRTALTAGDWIGADYEVPLATEVTYRADLFDAINGAVVESVTSGPVQVPAFKPGRIYLHNVATPNRMHSPQVEEFAQVQRESKSAVYEVVGRSTPVVVASVRSSRSGSLSLFTRTLQERDELWRLFSEGDVLLLRSEPEYGVGNLYIAVNNVTEERVTRFGWVAARRFTLEFVETGSPVGSALTAANNSWQVVLTGASTWEALMALRSNWSEAYVQPIGSAEEGEYRGDVPDL